MTNQAFPDLRAHVASVLQAATAAVTQERVSIVVERPKQAQHGDYACSVAMQLAKVLKRNPRDIAAALIAALPASPYIAKTEIAGAGFINIFLQPAIKGAVVPHILARGIEYGRSNAGGGMKIQVEFVSANPTGPLHVGHGRGAAFGASLANVLTAAGFDVQREYYVNDAGRQMDILALSTWLRYLELVATGIPFPANAYQGDYVTAMARSLLARDGKRYLRNAPDLLAGAPDATQDAESHLDHLIATAKRLLAADYATRPQPRTHHATGRLSRRSRGIRRSLRLLVFGTIVVRLGQGRKCRHAAGCRGTSLRQRRGDVVSLDRLRRREGPGRAPRKRSIHLLCFGHCLPS